MNRGDQLGSRTSPLIVGKLNFVAPSIVIPESTSLVPFLVAYKTKFPFGEIVGDSSKSVSVSILILLVLTFGAF